MQEQREASAVVRLEKSVRREELTTQRLELAHIFKFLAQDYCPGLARRLRYEDVRYRSYYSAHAKAFDKLHFILTKYGIDPKRFFAYTLREGGVCTPESLLDASRFRRYAAYLARSEQFTKIRNQFMKSVSFVAGECLRLDISPARYICTLVVENRLGVEYVSGRLSKYFLASIQNFKELYEHLDKINKDELRIIYDAAGELVNALDEAFVATGCERMRPIKAVETAVAKLKKQQTN